MTRIKPAHHFLARSTVALGLAGLLLSPAWARAEIEQRQVVSAIAALSGSEGGDVLTLASVSGCGGTQVRMDAGALGLDAASYAAMKTQLADLIRDKTPLLMRIDACPVPGNGGADARPVISKLGRCEPRACADGKARLYLNHNLSRSEAKERSRYALVLPLPPGKAPDTWQVEVFHVRDGEPRRLSGLVDSPDYLRGKLVGNYAMYYPHGQAEMQVVQDGRGVNEGTQTRFRPDGKLASRATWRNGVPEGEQRADRQADAPGEADSSRVGARADSVLEAFDDDGKLRTRTTLLKGQTDSELLLFYPDGAVQSRALYANGRVKGTPTEYLPDGKVRGAGN